MKPKTKLIEKAIELLKDEHPGCDQNTCLIQIDVALQYPVHIIDLFNGSGAASSEFSKLASKIVTRKQNLRDAHLICENIPHMECRCGSIIWDIYNDYLAEEVIGCDSCGAHQKWVPEIEQNKSRGKIK